MHSINVACVSHLFFAFLDLLFLLACEEFAHLLTPAKNPLIYNNELASGGIKAMIHAPPQSLTLTSDTQTHTRL